MTEKEALKQLDETNEARLLEALEFVREEGNTPLLIKSIQLFSTTEHKRIKEACIKLLEDLNNDASASVLANALEQESFASIHPALLNACWKNGRNYADHLAVFVAHFVSQPFEAAFDAFTVIEQQAISANQASEALLLLKEQAIDISEDKKALAEQLEKLLTESL